MTLCWLFSYLSFLLPCAVKCSNVQIAFQWCLKSFTKDFPSSRINSSTEWPIREWKSNFRSKYKEDIIPTYLFDKILDSFYLFDLWKVIANKGLCSSLKFYEEIVHLMQFTMNHPVKNPSAIFLFKACLCFTSKSYLTFL